MILSLFRQDNWEIQTIEIKIFHSYVLRVGSITIYNSIILYF